jgi:PIN domain nuclease of toxin-antitoxin system
LGDRPALIVLDTHVWVWWALEPKRLSRRAAGAIETADAIGISTISCFEVGVLVERGRVELYRDVRLWLAQALAQERFEALPLTPEIATDAALLEREGFHGDPGDRIVYATARAMDARLVTKDVRIRRFDRRRTLW